MDTIDECMKCETEIPGGERVCPKCKHPMQAVTREHVWAPATLGGSGAPSNKPVKYICRECGRVQTVKKFKYQRHPKA